MIFYNGKGLLVLVFLIISLGIAIPFADDSAEARDQWKIGVGLLVGAAFNIAYGSGLDRKEHHFYFIPLTVWGVIFAVGGVALIVSSFV